MEVGKIIYGKLKGETWRIINTRHALTQVTDIAKITPTSIQRAEKRKFRFFSNNNLPEKEAIRRRKYNEYKKTYNKIDLNQIQYIISEGLVNFFKNGKTLHPNCKKAMKYLRSSNL